MRHLGMPTCPRCGTFAWWPQVGWEEYFCQNCGITLPAFLFNRAKSETIRGHPVSWLAVRQGDRDFAIYVDGTILAQIEVDAT